MNGEVNGEFEPKKEETKEKKESWFSKTFNKAKQAIEDTNREGKLENEYRAHSRELTIYTGSLLTKTYYGKFIDDKTMEIYGLVDRKDIPYSSVLELQDENRNSTYYYILDLRHFEDDKVSLTIEEKVNDRMVENTYERPVTIITLDPKMEPVDVIKVKDRYFLRKAK